MLMVNSDSLRRVGRAPFELRFEVARYELVQVIFHKLTELDFDDQQKRGISCSQEIFAFLWHPFYGCSETYVLPESESELR